MFCKCLGNLNFLFLLFNAIRAAKSTRLDSAVHPDCSLNQLFFNFLAHSQAISVNVVHVNSAIIESVVGHGNTLRNDISHQVKSFYFVPFAHERNFLEIFHCLVLVGASEIQNTTIRTFPNSVTAFTFQRPESDPRPSASLQESEEKSSSNFLLSTLPTTEDQLRLKQMSSTILYEAQAECLTALFVDISIRIIKVYQYLSSRSMLVESFLLLFLLLNTQRQEFVACETESRKEHKYVREAERK